MGEGGGEGADKGDAASVRDEQGDQAGRHHHCTHLFSGGWILLFTLATFISSDKSSYSDAVLVYIQLGAHFLGFLSSVPLYRVV